jgi:hypothetical protein
MKKLVIVILKNTKDASYILRELEDSGINGTVYHTTSVHKLIEEEEEDHPIFINLNHVSQDSNIDNITLNIVLDETRVAEAKNIILKYTGNFTKIKGGIMTINLEDFQGSF